MTASAVRETGTFASQRFPFSFCVALRRPHPGASLTIRARLAPQLQPPFSGEQDFARPGTHRRVDDIGGISASASIKGVRIRTLFFAGGRPPRKGERGSGRPGGSGRPVAIELQGYPRCRSGSGQQDARLWQKSFAAAGPTRCRAALVHGGCFEAAKKDRRSAVSGPLESGIAGSGRAP